MKFSSALSNLCAKVVGKNFDKCAWRARITLSLSFSRSLSFSHCIERHGMLKCFSRNENEAENRGRKNVRASTISINVNERTFNDSTSID